VRQIVHLQEIYRDAQSTNHTILKWDFAMRVINTIEKHLIGNRFRRINP